ncbi:response regulator [Fodinibius sp. Rm-B-1B1-1]|uniref:response regulator n=1 Tax=Fodinibius alkaliphilus TaxID=3140241 RepID=UPI003159B724
MKREYPPKIFIVDDSEVQLVLLKKVLRNEGYQVKAFVTAQKLLNRLTDEDPDLIISDIDMPMLNGFELVQKIKSRGDLKQVPCLLVSSKPPSTIQEKVRRVGAAGFIQKPFKHHFLKNTIHSLLNRQVRSA